MKLQKTLPIALVLSVVLITLTGLSSTASAQRRPLVADSGLILLADNETLTATVVTDCCIFSAGAGGGPVVKARMISYDTNPGVNGLLRIVSDVSSQTLMIGPDSAAVFDLLLPAVQKRGSRMQIEVRGLRGEDSSVEVHFERIVVTGGQRNKQYVGHVTLNR